MLIAYVTGLKRFPDPTCEGGVCSSVAKVVDVHQTLTGQSL